MDNESEPKLGDRKRKANWSSSSSSISNCTFVWAREGNHEGAQEHAAYLLPPSDVPSGQLIAEDDGDGEDEYVYVRWCSTGTISRIQKSNISTEELSSRRRSRRSSACSTQQQARESNSRLSLSKKQRQHWRDQQQQRVQCHKQDRGTQLDDCKDDQVQKRHKSSNENKSINMEHDAVSIGCRPSPIIGSLNVSVDDSDDDAAEEKKEDDATIQSNKPISVLPNATATNTARKKRVVNSTNRAQDVKQQAHKMIAIKRSDSASRIEAPIINPLREYFHARTNQPIASARDLQDDSDCEDADDWLHTMSEKLIDDFDDVSEKEKKFMNLWNRFIKCHHVIADRDIPRKVESFIVMNREKLREGDLRTNLLLHLTNLWDESLISSNRISSCMAIYDDREMPSGRDGCD
jgi:hypothetical protein